MPYQIRRETAADREPIAHVHRLAFGQEAEARLVDALRDGGYLAMSLVAEDDGQVVGHIAFSMLRITTASGDVPALSLAPVAVLPARQREGIGSALIRAGLDAARAAGHRVVIVLGEPAYYRRFGFRAELAAPLRSAYACEAFQSLELSPDSLDGVEGDVVYPPPFAAL
jgi:putative acetyltransferase